MTPDVVYAGLAAWTAVRLAQIIAADRKDKRARAAKGGGAQ